MSATWQCASISPGMTVAPPSRTTSAPGAAARTASACPTAAIRPARTSMLPAGPAPGAIVTISASVTISSTMPPGPSVPPPGRAPRPSAGHLADVESREAKELVHDVRHPLQPGHVDLSERIGIERHDRGLHLRQAERRRERLHGPLHGGPVRIRDLLALFERGAERRQRLRVPNGPLPGDGAALHRERIGRALVQVGELGNAHRQLRLAGERL